jgi:hypothetical protein
MMRTAVILLLTALISGAYSQGKDNSLKGVPPNERIVTGGGFGLGFGSQQDYIMLSPMLGYMLTQKLVAGASVTYRYTNYKFYKPSLKLNDFGIGPFMRFTIYNGIFAQIEYEYLNYEFPSNYPETSRTSFSSFLAGGGFLQPLGGKAVFYVMALYNFSYKTPLPGQYTAYSSPLIVRAGINIGNFMF